MKIAFFGLPLAAILLARDGHDICLASISRTDGVGLPRLRRVLGAERVLVKPRLDDALLERVKGEKPDLVVSWYWTHRIPMSFVSAASLGGFGVHPSLLPRHRGPDPTTWAIWSGDELTGVTAHRLEEDYDTGAILKQETLRIDPDWSAFDLARALDRPSLRVLREVAAAFSRGEPPPERAQHPEEATDAPFPDDEMLAIRWTSKTADVLRRIRALAPAPGASTELRGRVVTILRARAAVAPPFLEVPGEGMAIEGRILIRTADGAVEIVEAELDGELSSAADLAEVFAG
jgi:methionyl-tRNA formyltransferase